MILFNNSGQTAGGTNAVTAHIDRFALIVFIHVIESTSFRVFCAEFKGVAYLDTVSKRTGPPFSLRAFANTAQIGSDICFEIR